MLLIDCDPFHSFSFPFICYFFEAAAQKCSPQLCENTCIGVLLKKAEAVSFVKRVYQSFFLAKFVKFFITAFF